MKFSLCPKWDGQLEILMSTGGIYRTPACCIQEAHPGQKGKENFLNVAKDIQGKGKPKDVHVCVTTKNFFHGYRTIKVFYFYLH